MSSPRHLAKPTIVTVLADLHAYVDDPIARRLRRPGRGRHRAWSPAEEMMWPLHYRGITL